MACVNSIVQQTGHAEPLFLSTTGTSVYFEEQHVASRNGFKAHNIYISNPDGTVTRCVRVTKLCLCLLLLVR